MKAFCLFLLPLALGAMFPASVQASSFERPRAAAPATRIQKPDVYRLVYIVDERGHLVLVRHDGAVERVPESRHAPPQRRHSKSGYLGRMEFQAGALLAYLAESTSR